jgi:hypothetical protein
LVGGIPTMATWKSLLVLEGIMIDELVVVMCRLVSGI